MAAALPSITLNLFVTVTGGESLRAFTELVTASPIPLPAYPANTARTPALAAIGSKASQSGNLTPCSARADEGYRRQVAGQQSSTDMSYKNPSQAAPIAGQLVRRQS